MNDLELADKVQRFLVGDPVCGGFSPEEWQQIIAALRRGHEPEVCPRCKGSGEAKGMTSGHGPDDYEIDVPCPDCNGTGERPPSGEMVMVPRELPAVAQKMAEAVQWIIRDAAYKAPEQIGDIADRWITRLREVEEFSSAVLSAAEAEGRKS